MSSDAPKPAVLKQGAYLVLMRVRIYVGGLVPLALLILGHWQLWMFLIGIVWIALGAALRIYSAGIIHKDRELSTTGPYALCRNPLYLGTILIQFGIGLLSGSWLYTAIALVIFIGIYTWVILLEERWLAGLFGDVYKEYLRTTPRLLPAVRSLSMMSREAPFSWKQAKVNRELKSRIAPAAAVILFLIKYVFVYVIHR
jgi:protein-S-isoprenylcysteine O-methyltransferase Ste14